MYVVACFGEIQRERERERVTILVIFQTYDTYMHDTDT